MLTRIRIDGLAVHARHGVLPQERTVGNDYVVNVSIAYPLSQACISDDLADTLNYAEALAIVQEEMRKPSKLLENVAYRICQSLHSRFPLCSAVDIDIEKLNPPMTGDCKSAGVSLHVEMTDVK